MSESASAFCSSISTVEIKNNVISGNTIRNENLDSFGDRYLAKGGGIWLSTAMEPGGTALIKVTDNEIRNNGPADGPTFSTGGGIFAHTRTDGYGTETIEIRLAALATLEAIRKVTATPPFRLVGVKQMHAFDADVILVALRDPEIEGTSYIGAVPVRTTHVAAAAAAVMDATNRVLFRRAGLDEVEGPA